MFALDWQLPYKSEESTNAQLADDFRLFVAAVANLDAGKNEPFTREDIIKWATACIREIIERVKKEDMKFTIAEEKSEYYEKLWKAVLKELSEEEISAITTDSSDSDSQAIYLVSPHAELISARKKGMIVKSRDFSQMCKKELIFCSSGLCFGTLKMKLPRKYPLSELDELYPLHRITPAEIKDWWPEVKEFYCYDIYDVTIWKSPRHAEIPQGVQTFIKKVKFLDSEELAPVNSSGIELGEELTREDIMPYFKSFYRTKPYVSLIGGICTQGKTKGDVDFFINSNFRDIATEFRIIRMFPQEFWHRFRFTYPFQQETHPGKFTSHLDIYDEKIEVVSKPELVLMSAPKKVELFKHFPMLKPLHGRKKEEAYSIDSVIETIKSRKDDWFKVGIFVEIKYDGTHIQCHKQGDRVMLITEDGTDVTKNCPTIVKELATKAGDWIACGEMELWKGGRHQPRADAAGILNSKEVHPDEKYLRYNFFDKLWHYGVDIHQLPFSERIKHLEQIADTEHIKKSKRILCHSEAEVRAAIEKVSKEEGSEGAYLKKSNFRYFLTGRTTENIKYKVEISLDAVVLKKNKVAKTEKTFYYHCGLKSDSEIVYCGKTFNTNIDAKVGDILKVVFVDISGYTTKEGKRWCTWWSPRPVMLRTDKKEPDTIDTAWKMVKATTGRFEEKKMPDNIYTTEKLVDSTELEEDASNPFLTYPDEISLDAEGYMKSPSEDKKWLGMIQFDSRKKNVGIDFRWQVSDSTIAAFTVFVPRGLPKIPQDPADAQKILTKEILPLVKETMADPLKKFNCQPKNNINATKDVFDEIVGYGPGYDRKRFMWTVDSFQVEHGCKKPHYIELFCKNDWINGRIVFVKIPNKAEWERTPQGEEYTWMFFKTKTDTPYVLSTRAVKKKFVPPHKVSALPRRIRDKIPEKYKYWEQTDKKKRLEIRDKLVNEIKKKLLVKLDAIKKAKIEV